MAAVEQNYIMWLYGSHGNIIIILITIHQFGRWLWMHSFEMELFLGSGELSMGSLDSQQFLELLKFFSVSLVIGIGHVDDVHGSGVYADGLVD